MTQHADGSPWVNGINEWADENKAWSDGEDRWVDGDLEAGADEPSTAAGPRVELPDHQPVEGRITEV